MFEKKVKVVEQKGVKKEVKVVKKGNGNSIGEKVLSALKILVIPALFAGVVSIVIYMAMENKAQEAQLKTQVPNIFTPTRRYKNPVIHKRACPTKFPVSDPFTSIPSPAPIIQTMITATIEITANVSFIENRMFFRSSLADSPAATCPII